MNTTTPGDPDERRIRQILRSRGVGPDAQPQPVQPQSTAAPAAPAADWWDRLYADEQPPETPGETHGPWWTIRSHTPQPQPDEQPVQPQPPGVHVTITPTASASAISPRKARIRWWAIRRGTAAGIGWWIGIGPAAADALATAGPGGAVGFALLLWIPAWWLASIAQRLVPRAAVDEVHTAADWAAHIPSSAILLALALHTPGAML